MVSLPEEAFSSGKATVKASLVFLRLFTEADETACEAAWSKTHADHDASFNAQRHALRADLGREVVTAEDTKVEDVQNSRSWVSNVIEPHSHGEHQSHVARMAGPVDPMRERWPLVRSGRNLPMARGAVCIEVRAPDLLLGRQFRHRQGGEVDFIRTAISG